MNVLIIVPAHNEAAALPSLIRELISLRLDFLVINDDSSDRTESILLENGWNHLNLPNNIGLAGVTQMGFLYARDHGYEAAVVVDGDGQHPPGQIHDLVSKLEEGYDYAIGSRYIHSRKPWTMRMVGSRLICAVIKLKTGRTIADPTSGMRALNAKVISDFAGSMNYIAEPDALVHLLRHHYKVAEVPVTMIERESGVSYFHNPLKSIRFMADVLISILLFQW